MVAIVMGGLNYEQYTDELAHHGADVVATACAEALSTYWTEAYAATLAAAIEERKPHTVLVPSSANGRDLAGRVAARLGLGLTGDCVGLEVDEQGRLVQLKPAFGGNIDRAHLLEDVAEHGDRPARGRRAVGPQRRTRGVAVRARGSGARGA